MQVQKLIDDNRKARVLASISSLKKLCNHPKVWPQCILPGIILQPRKDEPNP